MGAAVYPEWKNYNIYNCIYFRNLGFTNIKLRTSIIKGYRINQIEIRLNPEIMLNGSKIELFNPNSIKKIESSFDDTVQKIHSNLPTLQQWTVQRIDYAIQIYTIYSMYLVQLFNRGDKPSKKYSVGVYSKKDFRNVQMQGSLYMRNKSVTINFYDKKDEQENAYMWGNSNKQDIMDSQNLLRFEVQCKRYKTNSLKQKYNFSSKCLSHFLCEYMAKNLILHYYNEIIGPGDYYKLNEAEKIINSSDYRNSTKENCINMLKLISDSRSIWKAREDFVKGKVIKNTDIYVQGSLATYQRRLKQIRNLNINPVAIPKDYIKFPMRMIENPIKQIEDAFNRNP